MCCIMAWGMYGGLPSWKSLVAWLVVVNHERGQNRHFRHLARKPMTLQLWANYGLILAMLVFKIPLGISNVVRILQRLRYKQCLLYILYYTITSILEITQIPKDLLDEYLFIYGDHHDLLIQTEHQVRESGSTFKYSILLFVYAINYLLQKLQHRIVLQYFFFFHYELL